MKFDEFMAQIATDLHPSFQAGLNDMHHALQAFPDSMAPSSVLGQVGMPTSGEVDRAQNFDDHVAQQTQAAPQPERQMEME